MPRLSRALCALLILSGLAACHGRPGTDELLAEAQAYRQQGETKAAVIQLKNALQNAPDNTRARLLLGQVYIDAGDPLSAEKELRKALSLGEKSELVWPSLGQAMLMMGQFDKLLLELADDTRQPALRLLRANAYLGLGKIEPARQLYAQVLQAQPDMVPALLGMARIAVATQQLDQAISLIQQALKKDPADTDSLRLKGDVLRIQGKNDAALLVYQHILQLHPDNTLARIDIASLHIQAGHFNDARAEIGIARKTAPTSLAVMHAQALLDFREGKNKAALEGLQQILRVAPDHMPSILLAGSVQLALGAQQQAEQYLHRFLDANPGHPYAIKMLASIAMARGQTDSALDMVMPLLQSNPDDVELLSIAGEANMRARRFTQAAGYFEKASALAPDTAALHTALGVTRLGLGENARALVELERATQLDTGESRAGIMLVMTLLRNHDNDKALAAVNSMQQRQPNNPLVLNLKGGVYLSMKNVVAARASFEQALRADPAYMPALENLSQLDISEKKPQQAQKRLEAALSKQPKSADLTMALARLASLQGNKADTLRWLERASKDHPDALPPAIMLSNFYLQNGDTQKALTLAQNLQSSNPSNPQTLALRAQVEYGAGNVQAALDSYYKLAQLQPHLASLQMRIAGLQISMNDIDGALQSVKRALTLEPNLLEAQVMQVALLLDKGKPAEALVLARRLQQQQPLLAAGFKLEGDVLMAQKQPLPALAMYDKAFSLSKIGPLQIQIHRALLQAGKPQDAARRIDAWLAANPADLSTRLYLAGSRLARKEYKPAIEQYEKIVAQDGRHIIALNDLAWAYQQDQDGRALATAERAHHLAPDNPVVLDTLGWILVTQGDAKRALPLLQRAAKAAPGSADTQYHLGVAWMKSGDKKAARKQLERAIATSQEFAHRAEAQALLTQL
ncbi:putative PEP-CTERM system TPR-repeat lipoprotein [Janthinobacterium agaricidamnosum NBRC 102515 = DSM 9628]|uniref:Putative PEP-CTERM system TPR-repeat lipoprotein n=2 Tax=Janthinobacterium agaricidamnosum TaxID=55508 RepID=W0V347_9BURK|nr:XrtA/PEP-CTERM system TPR-repeat protein PrsT [Janthinobacterium agaricidamnosum]CDG83259.1 putative PEP-CTERM system TPR-repeat lipoprotein [Janthinobacterium agaricidamnosum NBRC 102515 = DSM 9628]